jgi:hypothetical protein
MTSRHRAQLTATVILSATVLAACASGAGAPTPEPTRVIPELSPTAAAGVDTSGIPEPVVTAVVADAAARLGVDASALTITSAESVDWPDGSLGCPKPGELYTQAIVSGYHIVVEADGQRLDYRIPQDGEPRLCENPPGPG